MKRIAKISDIILIILLVISNISLGTPLRYNIRILNLTINIVAIIYLGVLIYKKEKIKINKIDIAIITLSFSTFIPLIFNTYLRLGDTVQYILRYISALNIYFIIKRYIKKDTNKVNVIINVSIFMSILLIIIGIDIMTLNKFDQIYNFLKSPILQSKYNERMMSLFKYANTFCVYICVAFILSLGSYLKSNKKSEKAIYLCCMFMQLFAIITTYSRLCWGILGVLLIAYVIIVKDYRKKTIRVFVVTIFSSFIYYCLFNKFRSLGNYGLMWIVLVLQNCLQFTLFLYTDKIKFYMHKLNTKAIKICISSIAGIIAILVIITIFKPSDLTLYTNENYKKTYNRSNIAVDVNTKYTLKADIDAESSDKNNIKICVIQYDTEENQISKDEVVFDNFKGIKELQFETKEITNNITISFRCIKPSNSTKLVVHSVILNDKKIKVYYPLIPINLINRIEKFKLNTASTNSRIIYIKKAIEIAKNEPLSGLGGNAWKYIDMNDIDTKSIAEHCYPLQLLLQNGIIAFIAYIFLIISLCVLAYKVVKTQNIDIIQISIIFALAVIMLHSLLDFDMYFQIMILEMYMFIAILNNNESEEGKGINIISYLYMLVLVIMLYFNIGEVINSNINTTKIEDKYERVKVLDAKIKLTPYDYNLYEEKVRCLTIIKNNGLFMPGAKIEEQIIENTRFITDIEKLKDSDLYKRIIINKIYMMTEENQDEILQEIKNIWENEIGVNNKTIYEEIKERLMAKMNNDKTKEFIENLIGK